MVSIIVPMYNAEKTIERCLLSVMNQSYQDLEIIVIDDGSTDGGQKIVDVLAKNDTRLKYYWQENGGVSSARNHGIDISCGEFICFIDSDDAVTEDYIALLFHSINKKQSDIAVCGYCEVKAENKTNHLIAEAEERSLQGFLQTDLYTLRRFIASPCMKIYRAEIIRKLHLRFREDMVLAEDQFFNFHYFESCGTISFVNKPAYIYYRDDSRLSMARSIQCFHNELENLSYEISYMERQHVEKGELMIAEYICYFINSYTFIPNGKNSGADVIGRLKKMNLLKRPVKLPYWKDNLLYQFMYRELYHTIYLYKKISLAKIHKV